VFGVKWIRGMACPWRTWSNAMGGLYEWVEPGAFRWPVHIRLLINHDPAKRREGALKLFDGPEGLMFEFAGEKGLPKEFVGVSVGGLEAVRWQRAGPKAFRLFEATIDEVSLVTSRFAPAFPKTWAEEY
jgi:hypothetical protein